MVHRIYLMKLVQILPAIVLALSCGKSDRVCVPGVTQSCLCVGGGFGVQYCNSLGNGWGLCDCGNIQDGGVSADGGLAPDGGAIEDGGPLADGGLAPDGGTVEDGGPLADGGQAPDGGPLPDGGEILDGGSASDGGQIDCSGYIYPSPPYGRAVGEIVQNHCFLNHLGRVVKLSDYYNTAKAIVFNSCAAWSGVCRTEAAHLQSWYASDKDKGLSVLSSIFEDNSGAPASQNFAVIWRTQYNITYEVLIDPFFEMGYYYDRTSTPFNMVINGSNMKIEYLTTGFGSASMRNVIDRLLNN